MQKDLHSADSPTSHVYIRNRNWALNDTYPQKISGLVEANKFEQTIPKTSILVREKYSRHLP